MLEPQARPGPGIEAGPQAGPGPVQGSESGPQPGRTTRKSIDMRAQLVAAEKTAQDCMEQLKREEEASEKLRQANRQIVSGELPGAMYLEQEIQDLREQLRRS